MRRRNRFVVSLLCVLLGAATLSVPGWTTGAVRATAPSRDRPEPARSGDGAWKKIVTGRLSNGVRFAILPRRGDEPGVALLMRNEGGFIAEQRPGERGLAHLIEHIFFLSPTVGAPDDYRRLPRIGLPLTFPAPNAGSTSWRESNYYVSTRTRTPADLDTLLALFSEAATDLTFRTDAVDAGRAEVVREMADKAVGNRTFADYVAAVAPGSPNDVIDAQNSDDVPTATIETIRLLYRRLYRPDAMMVVVVGDVDAVQTRALIEKRFGNWRADRSGQTQTSYPVFQRDRIRPISFSALERGRRTAMTAVVMPTPPVPAARDQQIRAALLDLIAVRAIGDRLAASQPGTPAGKVGIFIENAAEGHRQIMLWDNFADDRWKPAVAQLRRTTCDLVVNGFTDGEWAAAKRNVVADLQRRTEAMAKVPNVELAKDLSHAVAEGRDLVAPDEMLRSARAMLPGMDARSASDWWRRQWRSGVEHIRVETPALARVGDPLAEIGTAAKAGPAAGSTMS